MRLSVWRVLVCVCALCMCVWGRSSRERRGRYMFYRELGRNGSVEGSDGRRVFGGAAAALGSLPGVCALLDRYWSTRCSGAVLADNWVLTAAHCVTPRLAYVKYNTRRPSETGDTSPVLYLYRHPKYRVVQEDEGRGTDVTLLHHDVGLVRTKDRLVLREGPVGRSMGDAVAGLTQHNPLELHHEEVEVLGFGRTEQHAMGEELCAVRLRLVFCERGAWFHCMCGVAQTDTGAGAASGRGVCSGDSGGPVLYRGAQVAVTSMGPLECGSTAAVPASATSVFTSLFQYADLINSTMHDTESALRMHRVRARAHCNAPTMSAMITALLLLSYFK